MARSIEAGFLRCCSVRAGGLYDGQGGLGPWSEKAGILYAQVPAWALARVIAFGQIHLDCSDAENGPLRVIPGSPEAMFLLRF